MLWPILGTMRRRNAANMSRIRVKDTHIYFVYFNVYYTHNIYVHILYTRIL